VLKSRIIDNTWKCDGCGLETCIVINPYYRVIIQKSIELPACKIDLCSSCINMITAQPVVDYIIEHN